MWESIKNFFGFGKKRVIVETPVVLKEAIESEISKPKTTKKPKSTKVTVEDKVETKVTAKEIKAKVKKEVSKPESEISEVKPKKTRRSTKKKSE